MLRAITCEQRKPIETGEYLIGARPPALRLLYPLLPMALLLSATMGCSDTATPDQRVGASEEAHLAMQAQEGNAEAAKRLKHIQIARDAMPDDNSVAPDIRDGWQWSAAEIAALTKRTKSGDMEAADRLSQYYSVHEDEANIAYWEDWLFRHGHRGATQSRALKLYSASKERPPNDPRKLVELKEAERLERSVMDGREKNVFLDKLRLEISSIEGSK
jgi:hypothetical protein